jgi:hypothetical protein
MLGGEDERHWSAAGTGGRGYDGAAPARPIKAAVVSGQFQSEEARRVVDVRRVRLVLNFWPFHAPIRREFTFVRITPEVHRPPSIFH